MQNINNQQQNNQALQGQALRNNFQLQTRQSNLSASGSLPEPTNAPIRFQPQPIPPGADVPQRTLYTRQSKISTLSAGRPLQQNVQQPLGIQQNIQRSQVAQQIRQQPLQQNVQQPLGIQQIRPQLQPTQIRPQLQPTQIRPQLQPTQIRPQLQPTQQIRPQPQPTQQIRPQGVGRNSNTRQSKISVIEQDPPRVQEQRRPVERTNQVQSRQSKLSVIDRDPIGPVPIQRVPSRRVPSRRVPSRRVVGSQAIRRRLELQTRNRTPVDRRRIRTASTAAFSTYSNYETLDFFPLVVGREEPEIFSEGLRNYEGWISEPDASYPIDVILGLDHKSNVYKVYMSVADHLVPSKVEIRVGRKRKEDEDPDYLTARDASYSLKATIRFDKRNTDLEESETKIAFIDSECQYLWFLFYAPHKSSINPTNQIRITGLTIEGYYLEQKRQRTSRSVDIYRDLTPVTPIRRPLPRRGRSRGETPAFYSDTRSVRSLINSQNGRISPVSSVLGSEISEEVGWKSNGENLAADPLMAVRLVRTLLNKKRKRSLRRNRDVEATICRRAVEALNGYEKQMTGIRSKMSEALQQGNAEEAKKQELALIDCRDTAFRVIHLDLLLERTELRAVGLQSKWSA